MRKYILTIFSLLSALTISAQNSQKLLDKFTRQMEKNGCMSMHLDVTIRNMNNQISDRQEADITMDGTRFHYDADDDGSVWFDGKTMWRASALNDEIGEIYISLPSDQEQFLLNPLKFMRDHKGFSVSGDDRSTFTLTASTPEGNVEGIRTISFTLDPSSLVPQTVLVKFADDAGGISAEITVSDYKGGLKLPDSEFKCNPKDYPDAEVIDLR